MQYLLKSLFFFMLFTLSLQATELDRTGWNLVGVCVDINSTDIDMTGIEEIQSQDGKTIYTGSFSNYSNLPKLEAGYGYWVKGNEGTNFNSGSSSRALKQPLSRGGWNLMASCEDKARSLIDMSNFTEIQAQNGQSIYTGGFASYSNLNTLLTGHGYWVKGEAGTLFSSKDGLSIPVGFDFQPTNSNGEAPTESFEGYEIKLLSDTNLTVDTQANHVGVVVNLNGQTLPVIQIQNGYIGHNIVVAIYDVNGTLVGLSNSTVIDGNVVISVNVENNNLIIFPPLKPMALDDVPSITEEENLTLKFLGEFGTKVYLDGQEVGVIDNDGQVSISFLLRLGENHFEITLKNAQGKESDALAVDIKRVTPKPLLLTTPIFSDDNNISFKIQAYADNQKLFVNGIDSGYVIDKNSSIITLSKEVNSTYVLQTEMNGTLSEATSFKVFPSLNIELKNQNLTNEVRGVSSSKFTKMYTFTTNYEKKITIAMRASFDTYLNLVKESGEVVTSDDDGGDSSNSKISEFILPKGKYIIEATSYSGSSVGTFDLNITEHFHFVDTTAPEKPILLTTIPAVLEDDIYIEISGEVGARVFINGEATALRVYDSGNIRFKFHILEGHHTYNITLKDDLGNESEALIFDMFKTIKAPQLNAIPYYSDSNITLRVKTNTDNSQLYVNGIDTGYIVGTSYQILSLPKNNSNRYELKTKISTNEFSEAMVFNTVNSFDINLTDVNLTKNIDELYVDRYSFTIDSDRVIIVDLNISFDSYLRLLDIRENGLSFRSSTSTGGTHITNRRVSAGTYIIEVVGQDSSIGGKYDLSIKERIPDTTAPTTPTLTVTIPAQVDTNTHRITVHGEVGATIYLNGLEVGVIDGDGTATIVLPLNVGTNNFSVTLRDEANNESEPLTFTVERIVSENNNTIIIDSDYQVEELGHETSISKTVVLGNTSKDLYLLLSNFDETQSASTTVVHNRVSSVVQRKATVQKARPTQPTLLHAPTRVVEFNNGIKTLFGSTPKASVTQKSSQKVTAPRADVVGDTGTFYPEVDTSISTASTVRKVVSSITTAFGTKTLNIWVSNDSFGTSCPKTNCVTQAMVDRLAEKFLKAGDDNDIYDWVTNIYGEEWGADAIDVYSGFIGANDEITILLTDIDNDNSPNGGVVGYFYGKDNLKKSEYSGSNERIMFYIDSVMFANTSVGDYWEKVIYGTLAHEFQHMIHMYQKDIKFNQNAGSEAWLNEMLSESTEDMVATKIQTAAVRGVAYTDGSSGTAGNHEGRFPIFNENNTRSVTNWTNQVVDYSTVSSFGTFLTRNYGGAKLLHDIVSNGFLNEQAIVDAVHKAPNGVDKTFADLLQEWGIAVILSDRTDVTDLPSYNRGDFLPSTYNNSTYELGSINFFNYDPEPVFRTYAGTIEAQANYYYKIGENLTGDVDVNLTLNGTTEAILIAK